MINLLIRVSPLKNINVYFRNTSLNEHLKHDAKNIYERLLSKSCSVEWEYLKRFFINTGPPV